MRNIGIVGLGRVGTALALSFQKCGFTVYAATKGTSQGKVSGEGNYTVGELSHVVQKAEVLFITTPDGVISTIVQQLANYSEINLKAVLHMSGSLPSDVLSPLKKRRIAVGSLHPLQSFASHQCAINNLPGSYFTYEGDSCLEEWVTTVVKGWGGKLKILSSPASKMIYHAGACIASNYLVALFKLSMECFRAAGFSEGEAREAILPLMRGTFHNLGHLPPESALTGPISRGDMEVVKGHITCLARELPSALPSYCTLATVIGEMAFASGKLSPEQYRDLIKSCTGGMTHG
ncbi:MAG: Rossmann-like and DUF2520 domain-containing protein [Bacillota bacterium]